MANEPRANDYAFPNGGGSANAVNAPPAAAQAVAAQDVAGGAVVHSFDPDAAPEEKAAAAKKGGFGRVLGAPKALGRGVGTVGRGAVKGVTKVGTGVVDVGTQGVGAVGRGVGTVAGGVGNVAGGVVGAGVGVVGAGVGAIGAGASGVKNLVGSVPGMGALKEAEQSQSRAVAIDTSDAGAPAPTVTVADAKKATAAAFTEDDIPGNIPKTVLPGIPNWVALGWKEAGGIEGRGLPDKETREQLNVLSYFLNDQYYGQWYHNAGIIIFAVVATRLVTALRLSWAWVAIVLAFCATYYSISIGRTRVRARDDIQRELVKTRLATETESADWINSFLDRFWLIYEPVLSATIVAGVDPALEANTPSFLDSIRLTTFTLGNKAPRIDYVRTFPRTDDDVVIMDWGLSFTPNDIQDTTPRQLEKRVNPKIVLTIRVGKGIVGAGMPILVEDINFSGKMRIKLKLMTNFPHVQKVEMSFLEKPKIDFVLKPLGGETFGFDIANIPGLAPFIDSQIHNNLGPMMYDPNVFTLDLEQMLSGTPLDAANGVLKVTIHSGKGLTATKLGGGNPDPYVSLSIGAGESVARTKTINDTSTPTWEESHFILVKSLSDVLNFNVYDYNDVRSDTLVGTIAQDLSTLADDAEQEDIVGQVLGGGKSRGEVRYDLSYFPALKAEKNADGTFQPLPETNTGIARLTVHQAKDLDKKDLVSVAKVFLGANKTPAFTSPVVKKNSSPAYEAHTEFIVPNKQASVVTVSIVEEKTQQLVGRVTIKLVDLLNAKDSGNDWFPLQGTKGGKVRLSCDFKPVAMAGAIDSAASYTAPIGILRLWLKEAVDVKNVEALTGGKSDPYVRVMHNNKILARTEVINNNLNPKWDQILYVPIHTMRERFILELMDYQNVGKDRSLGYVELDASQCAVVDNDNKEWPYASRGVQQHKDKIYLGKPGQYKGQLNFEVDFKPAMSLKGGISFDAKKNELEADIAKKGATPSNGTTTAEPGVAPVGADAAAAATTPAAGAPPPVAVEGAVKKVAAVSGSGDVPPTPPAKDAAKDADKSAAEGDNGAETLSDDPDTGVELTDEELLSYQSGIIVFQIVSGTLARKGALEIMLDDGYWPVYTSERARTAKQTWDQVGEGFIRELDWSRVWLRINANDDSAEPDVVGETTIDAKEFLDRTLNDKATFDLVSPDGSASSKVVLSARYIPIKINLEPRESILDQGTLNVKVIGAKNLTAADRGGKSDPNITFYINDLKVFKSETVKKTLNPTWNEEFTTVVPSRVRNQLRFEVNDWNTVGSADPLGGGVIDLTAIEPFVRAPIEAPVTLNGKLSGSVQLGALFTPGIIARTRGKTSTFSRTATSVGAAALGAPVAVGKGVVHGVGAVGNGVVHGVGAVGSGVIGGVGKGVGTVVSVPGKLFGRRKASSVSQNQPPVIVADDGNPVAGQDAIAARAATVPGVPGQPPNEPGTLTVTVVSATGLQPHGSHSASSAKPYVQLKLGSKSYNTEHQKGLDAEWNETYNFAVAPGTTTLTATVLDKHTFGKDPELGTADIDIWSYVQPAVPTTDVIIPLNEGGDIKLRLDWIAGAAAPKGGLNRARSRTPSVSSRTTTEGTPRTSKFSMTPSKKGTDG